MVGSLRRSHQNGKDDEHISGRNAGINDFDIHGIFLLSTEHSYSD